MGVPIRHSEASSSGFGQHIATAADRIPETGLRSTARIGIVNSSPANLLNLPLHRGLCDKMKIDIPLNSWRAAEAVAAKSPFVSRGWR